jgi:hypothetical protein
MSTRLSTSLKQSVLAGALILSQTLALTPNMVLAAGDIVYVAGQPVLTGILGAGSATSAARAEQIQGNLDNALVAAKDRTPAAVNIAYVKGQPVITLGGFQVVTVDSASAKAAGTTPAVLAQRWADKLRAVLRDQASVQSYVSQLSGDYASSAPAVSNAAPPQMQQQPPQGDYYAANQAQYQAPQPPQYAGNYNPPPGYSVPVQGYRQGRVAYAPAGLTIKANLATSITSQLAKPGDLVQANVSQAIMLGDSQIPLGSVLLGQVSDAQASRRFGLTGKLGILFNRLRTPDGVETPISAHLVGGIGKYDDKANNDQFVGETWKNKALQTGVRGAAGAGLGAALGTAVGAIAGGGRGAGRGAWSGTAIGGGLGVADSLLLRKGKEVTIPSGTAVEVQLDAPVSIAGGAPGQYGGAY